ncbi:MAG: hypothetical protein HC880_13050, partial [Bacteroidia bacterium]|nr:hypothetical protein [Bacteroidia bacterium]
MFKDRGSHKIKHYNYCDEQDPVGDRLEIFRGKPIYQKIFQAEEEEVYNRYV